MQADLNRFMSENTQACHSMLSMHDQIPLLACMAENNDPDSAAPGKEFGTITVAADGLVRTDQSLVRALSCLGR
jgi:hypothetical protein